MQLKGRLKLIADMVPECGIVCDVGTDHAYIPIYIVRNGKCKKAVASDVREGPVLSARKNVGIYGLTDSIDVRMGNGLEPLKENEADVIVIAGMGGILIRDILTADIDKAKMANSIILQPMNAIEVVREWLYGNGFCIYDEGLAKEGFKIYNVIAAKWEGHAEKSEEIYYYIGKKLIDKKEPLLVKYLTNKIGQIEKAVNEMDNMKDKDSEAKMKLLELKTGLSKILDDFESDSGEIDISDAVKE